MQIITAVSLERGSLAIAPEWPPGIRALLRRCLAQQPADRPTAAEAVGALEALLQESGGGGGGGGGGSDG